MSGRKEPPERTCDVVSNGDNDDLRREIMEAARVGHEVETEGDPSIPGGINVRRTPVLLSVILVVGVAEHYYDGGTLPTIFRFEKGGVNIVAELSRFDGRGRHLVHYNLWSEK